MVWFFWPPRDGSLIMWLTDMGLGLHAAFVVVRWRTQAYSDT